MKKLTIIVALLSLGLVASNAQAVKKGDPARGKQLSTTCAACHDADGNSTNPQFPRLAGQHADYMVQALKDYKSGKRQNAVMAGIVAELSQQDMEDLAAYFSGQRGDLYSKTL